MTVRLAPDRMSSTTRQANRPTTTSFPSANANTRRFASKAGAAEFVS